MFIALSEYKKTAVRPAILDDSKALAPTSFTTVSNDGQLQIASLTQSPFPHKFAMVTNRSATAYSDNHQRLVRQANDVPAHITLEDFRLFTNAERAQVG